MRVDRQRSESAAVKQAELGVALEIRRNAERDFVYPPHEQIQACKKQHRHEYGPHDTGGDRARALPFLPFCRAALHQVHREGGEPDG